jgi:hypothetical protein
MAEWDNNPYREEAAGRWGEETVYAERHGSPVE